MDQWIVIALPRPPYAMAPPPAVGSLAYAANPSSAQANLLSSILMSAPPVAPGTSSSLKFLVQIFRHYEQNGRLHHISCPSQDTTDYDSIFAAYSIKQGSACSCQGEPSLFSSECVEISTSFASRVMFVARIPSAKEMIALRASEGEESVALTGPNKLLRLVPTFHPCQNSAYPVTIGFHVCLSLILRPSSPEIRTQQYYFNVRIRQISGTIAKVPQ